MGIGHWCFVGHWDLVIRRPSRSLLFLLAGLLACLATALTTPPRQPLPGDGDAALYRAIVTRLQSGEAYYPAAGAELRARHYGLRSPLNWRTPTLAHLAATPFAKPLLAAISLTTLLLAIRLVKHEAGLPSAALAALLLPSSLLIPLAGDTYLFSELWAGILILLSLLLHRTRPLLATLPALAALFLRELATPYVLILLLHALPRKKGDASHFLPAAALGLGMLAYTAFYLYHRHQVLAHLRPDDPAYPSGYLTFQGLPFLLSIARQTTYLLLAPLVVTAIYLPISIYGLFKLPEGIRSLAMWSVGVYLALFSVGGKSFNDYWGLVIAPLLALNFVFGVSPLLRRWSGLRRTRVGAR